jgi:hypothetical protein
MTEGYNLFGVNDAFIATFPYNVPRLIQVIGRSVRNHSHRFLPKHKQFVNIHILVLGMREHADADIESFTSQFQVYQKLSDAKGITETREFEKQLFLTRDELLIWKKVNEY